MPLRFNVAIECGETECSESSGILCRFAKKSDLGQMFSQYHVCNLFERVLTYKENRLQRLPQCMQMEKEQKIVGPAEYISSQEKLEKLQLTVALWPASVHSLWCSTRADCPCNCGQNEVQEARMASRKLVGLED